MLTATPGAMRTATAVHMMAVQLLMQQHSLQVHPPAATMGPTVEDRQQQQQLPHLLSLGTQHLTASRSQRVLQHLLMVMGMCGAMRTATAVHTEVRQAALQQLRAAAVLAVKLLQAAAQQQQQ